MYVVWDADRGAVISSGHPTAEAAAALAHRVLADVARHDPDGELLLFLEVHDENGNLVADPPPLP
ncbi:hypothetical protein [Nocardiopsis suaedae]|uniref:DUF2188 domain-containing protein n=1 Tax=Nocardiopsis suaedae TaxID=3018444 RepID=A0ABT4TLW5_9ACTN|nr:hypothetical protein [Nocardiopsis suaedae]MDA2805690.1 hypothetical protein [Nocardiopsis suaedae]